MTDHPAIALVEFASIAIGTRATDALMKKAPVTLIRAGTIQPGKFAVLFSGEVAEVEESYVEALRIGVETVIDRVLLADVHREVFAAILGKTGDWNADTIGVIETQTMSAAIEAADAAVKGADVHIVQMRLGDGLHGKGIAHFGGEQADVEAAIDIGSGRVAYKNQNTCTTIIPRIDADLRSMLSKSTYFTGDR